MTTRELLDGMSLYSDNRTVGHRNGSLFQAHRQSSKDLVSIKGWSFSIDVLEDLDEQEVREIRVVDTKAGLCYEAKLSDFKKHGVYYINDRCIELCLPLPFWRCHEI